MKETTWIYDSATMEKQINRVIRALNAALASSKSDYKRLCRKAVQVYKLRGAEFYIRIKWMVDKSISNSGEVK